MPAPWNPSFNSIVGMEWLPTSKDTMQESSSTQAICVRVPAVETDETISKLWFYIGRSAAPGTAFAVDVYEDNLPFNQTVQTTTAAPAWDNPPAGFGGQWYINSIGGAPPSYMRPGSIPGLWWWPYQTINGVIWRDDAAVANTTGTTPLVAPKLASASDTDGLALVWGTTALDKPGPEFRFQANTGTESTWYDTAHSSAPLSGRRILGLGMTSRVRNYQRDSGTPILVQHLLRNAAYKSVINTPVTLEMSQLGGFTALDTGPMYTDPSRNAPWTLRGSSGALAFVLGKTESGVMVSNSTFGIRVAADKAIGNLTGAYPADTNGTYPFPQVMVSQALLKVWYLIAEDRVATGHLQLQTREQMPSSGEFHAAVVSFDTPSGETTPDGWVGINLRNPLKNPDLDASIGFTKRQGHEYYFVLRMMPNVKANLGRDVSLFGSVELGSFGITRIGEGPNGSNPRNMTTMDITTDASGILQTTRSTSTFIPATVLELDDTTNSTDGSPYSDFLGLPVGVDAASSLTQEITPGTTLANLQAVKLVAWVPQSTPTDPLTINVKSGTTILATGTLFVGDMGETAAIPDVRVVLLNRPITLTSGGTYVVEFLSPDKQWLVGTLSSSGTDGAAGYGGIAATAIYLDKDYPGDVPLSLHLVPSAPTGFTAQRISVGVE